jgi:hypothetical protein
MPSNAPMVCKDSVAADAPEMERQLQRVELPPGLPAGARSGADYWMTWVTASDVLPPYVAFPEYAAVRV